MTTARKAMCVSIRLLRSSRCVLLFSSMSPGDAAHWYRDLQFGQMITHSLSILNFRTRQPLRPPRPTTRLLLWVQHCRRDQLLRQQRRLCLRPRHLLPFPRSHIIVLSELSSMPSLALCQFARCRLRLSSLGKCRRACFGLLGGLRRDRRILTIVFIACMVTLLSRSMDFDTKRTARSLHTPRRTSSTTSTMGMSSWQQKSS